MSLSIAELLTVLTTSDVDASWVSSLDGAGLPASSWRRGGGLRSILRTAAGQMATFSNIVVDLAKARFLEYAEGGWLTLLARNQYGVERIPAAFATGEVQVSNTGGGVYTFAADEFKGKNPSTGKAYANTNAAPITVNPGETKDFSISAVEIGSSSSTEAGSIVEFETSFPGLSITNASAVLGNDEESDEDLRARCRAKLGALSLRGPRGAYEYAVRSATRGDGSPVNVNRYALQRDAETGIVNVYIAAPSGAADPLDVTAVEDSVEALARPDTVTVNVASATVLALTREVTIYAKRTAGLTAATLEDLVTDAVDAATARNPIGGYLKESEADRSFWEDTFKAAAIGAHEAIYEADGFGPDETLTADQVVTLSVTYTIRFREVD